MPQAARDVTHREAGTTWRKSRKSGAGDIPCISRGPAIVEARRLPQAARDVTHREAGTTWRKSRKSGAGDILVLSAIQNELIL
ncbi:hypothetical protein B0T94_25255 [Salmonella enterica subsp. enterica serovar Irumu]|nr:hypothetical protein [Salmonella enterica subsp. enterica serovar Irumu]EBD0702138.1 hypothetical protein [Salmonella enterica]